jgi:ectoine hydroxylase-related dioxygenase (phytanoyl-CoA dioxygenase family)
MEEVTLHQSNIAVNGYTIIPDIYRNAAIDSIAAVIEKACQQKTGFQKSTGLFAIRRFFKEVPEAVPLIFNDRMHSLISRLFGDEYTMVKSIYFDKPEESNWFVAYHQDLTIAVDNKSENNEYVNWTIKQDQYAVQPPLNILQQNYTLRIHLDDTDESNGALKVIPGSHNKGIYRPETINWSGETEMFCNVKKGGVMIMRPLLLHASNKTTNHSKRRVIHIEWSNAALPVGIGWAEKMTL